jgi:hypothetical protein
MTDEGDAQARTRMRESLQIAEAHLERLTVEVDVAGADIVVDGIHVGQSPLPFAWYMPPGSYRLSVEKVGHRAHSEQRLAVAGEHQHLRVSLLQQSPEPAAPLLSAPVPDDTEPPRIRGLWVAFGSAAAVAGVVGGVPFTLHAADNEDKASRLRGSIEGDCSPSPLLRPPPECASLSSALSQHDRQRLWALISFGAAGVAAASTVTYALIVGMSNRSTEQARARVTWQPAFGPHGAQLSVSGAF